VSATFEKTVAVMGGCGHVGLPLAIGLAEVGFQTAIYDIDREACTLVRSGKMPFAEEQAEEVLQRQLANGRLTVSSDPAVLSAAQFVICVVGTPVDEFLNPMVHRFFQAVETIRPHLRDGQVLVLRSTLYPQTSQRVHELFQERGPKVDVVVCPERVAQGKGYLEIKSLPQIVAGFSDRGRQAARFLFGAFGVEIVELDPIEAELAKLFQNVWRYLTFAVANQFYTLASDFGLDYYRIHHALTHHYPRGRGLPTPGFAAGPCLFKDTMQLAAFSNNHFFIGHAAMLVNEGLPLYVVQQVAKEHKLADMTVGILGMAFKADCDDVRDSLAFKLRKIFATRCKRVLCSDHHVSAKNIFKATAQIRPEEFLSAEDVVAQSDLLVIGVPHSEYKSLEFGDKPVVDVWNMLGRGGRIV
jgi:UDP-N-acetyl-D-mannosaminuronic acid dehydrogenase